MPDDMLTVNQPRRHDVKHTAGPWKVCGVVDHDFRITTEKNHTIATVRENDMLGQPRLQIADANSKLIAASPDLLAACKAALNDSPPSVLRPGVVEMLANAIHKAEGG